MNCFAYRLPGGYEIFTGASEHVSTGLGEGLIFASFDDSSTIYRINQDNIPSLDDLFECDIYKSDKYSIPNYSTTKEQHFNEVSYILDSILCGRLKKCVAARAINGDDKINIKDSFINLCNKYPDAFVFYFNSKVSGAWLGASPETLLRKKGHKLSTMALAGTRKAGCKEGWDLKNLAEQNVVTEYIAEVLLKYDLNPIIGPLKTKNAGEIEHLMTQIETFLPDSASNELEKRIISSLSPTPALCGFPTDTAMDLIKDHENFSRGFYGGFCGPGYRNGDFDLFVNLRSLCISQQGYTQFVGGGIVKDSNPDCEWEETERKALTIKSQLKFQKKFDNL